MYRKAKQEEIATNQTKMANTFQNTIEASQFLKRLVALPVVDSVIKTTQDFYGKAKNSGGLVGKTIGVAEYTTVFAVGQVLPYAQLLTPLAKAPLTKIDDLANSGLEKLENNVPVIKKQTQEIVSDTKELISARVSPAVQKFNTVSGVFLTSKVAQVTFDVVEHVLDSATTVVDTVLPPHAGGPGGDKTSNGFLSEEKTPEDKGARGGYLVRKALYLFMDVTKRLFGIAQSRVDSAVTATDTVVNSARKSLLVFSLLRKELNSPELLGLTQEAWNEVSSSVPDGTMMGPQDLLNRLKSSDHVQYHHNVYLAIKLHTVQKRLISVEVTLHVNTLCLPSPGSDHYLSSSSRVIRKQHLAQLTTGSKW